METSTVSLANIQFIFWTAGIFTLVMGLFAVYWLLRYGCILKELAKVVGEAKTIEIAHGTALLGLVKK